MYVLHPTHIAPQNFSQLPPFQTCNRLPEEPTHKYGKVSVRWQLYNYKQTTNLSYANTTVPCNEGYNHWY